MKFERDVAVTMRDGIRLFANVFRPDDEAPQRRIQRRAVRRFFDRFLKGEENGWDASPRVRLEVRRSLNGATVRAETAWPLAVPTRPRRIVVVWLLAVS